MLAYYTHLVDFCCVDGIFDCNLECAGVAEIDGCADCVGGNSGRVTTIDCNGVCGGPGVAVPDNPACTPIDITSLAAVIACGETTDKTACLAITDGGGCAYNGFAQGFVRFRNGNLAPEGFKMKM